MHSSSASTRSTDAVAPGRAVLTPASLREWLAARGEPAYRAAQILRWVYGRGAVSFDAMTDLGRALRAGLEETFRICRIEPERVLEADDGTRKLVFDLGATARVESVLIPDPPRLTLCLSSQAGCAMGCTFCATARLGLRRNLSSGEIMAQALAARRLLKPGERISNVVFMGMGEPLHNYDAVVGALEILSAAWGLAFSPRRITVSTVGLVPQMERLIAQTRVNLAVSLTAATDALRSELVPVNRKYPIEVLLDACRRLPIPQRKRITFEYVLLAGVNDAGSDARELARLLRGIRCKVNLIPFNPFPGGTYRRPGVETIEAFRTALLEHGLHATVRASRGRDVAAACGQLAGASTDAI